MRNEQYYKTGMFICLQVYQIKQDVSLDSEIRKYESQVKTANEWTILTRGAEYSDKHPDEWSTINILLNIKNCELRR